MVYIQKSSVLIIGMGSTGVETAKNLILAGVQTVVIYDTKLTQMSDLSAQVIHLKIFFLMDSIVNKNQNF